MMAQISDLFTFPFIHAVVGLNANTKTFDFLTFIINVIYFLHKMIIIYCIML